MRSTPDPSPSANWSAACPRCRGPLAQAADTQTWTCNPCQLTFPLLAGVPCLFAEPLATLSDWRNRWQLAIAEADFERNRAKRALTAVDSKPGGARLEHLVNAYAVHVQSLQVLLAPLGEFAHQDEHASLLALRTRLPSHHRLLGYEANVFRDWVWGDAENEASRQEVVALAANQAAPRVLVLGAGAGRLAYDLHSALSATTTVALDANPYLALVANQLWQERPLTLVEFPTAPRSVEDTAVVQTLAPQPAPPGLHLVLANALRPPFPDEHFDLVVTPWLVDVIDAEASALLPVINRLLRKGGRWINHGSMVFAHNNPAACHSLEELMACATREGFTQGEHRETELRYLDSPHSRHRRLETVCTTAWEKTGDATPMVPYQSLPEWLVTGRTPVPNVEEFALQAQTTRVHAFIMSMIDGKRSLRDMAKMMEAQGLMGTNDAQTALRGFLLKMLEEAASRSAR